MSRTLRWTSGALLVVASLVGAHAAGAQTNVAAQANNPLAQGYASDGGYSGCCSLNGPLDGVASPSWSESTSWHSAAQNGAWWYVDLAQNWSVSSIEYFGRGDCCTYRNFGALFQLWASAPDFVNGGAVYTAVLNGAYQQLYAVPNVTARYASIQAGNCGTGDCYLNFAEVEVNAVPVVTATPEPASMALLATGLFGVVAVARRKRGKTQRTA